MNARLQYCVAAPLSLVVVLASAVTTSACSVPVYRYALERWPSDFYRVVVFHKGPLTKAQKSLVDDMGPYGTAGEKHANLRVKTVDVSGKLDAEMRTLWQSQQAAKPQLPWMVVRYPDVANYAPAWSGPLTKTAVDSLIDSPVRRELAKRILTGETAVWILLESGEKKADDAAYQELKSQLAAAEKTLKLPEVDPKDLVGEGAASEVANLRIRFTIIRVSRGDAKETMLVEMLLGSEGSGKGSLRDPEYVKQTMAFPIFGRGRIRYGLVGKGIAKDTIHEACEYLTGPCKCQIKQGVENRGMDMVTAIDWNRMVTTTIKDKPEPPLLGLGGLDTKVPTLRTGPSTDREPVAAVKPHSRLPRTTQSVTTPQRQPDDVARADSQVAAAPPSPPAAESGQSNLLRNVGILFAILVLAIIGGSLFLRPKST